MTARSNNNGRAYEYAYLQTLKNVVSKVRSVDFKQNSALESAQRAWETLNEPTKKMYEISASAAVAKLLELEPLILDEGNDKLELSIQKDGNGVEGDVRDILILRNGISWEIGLSIKHNHEAVKHSRLSNVLDFGEKWFNIPCSSEYWEEVNGIFEFLEQEKIKGTKWKNLPVDKEDDVYVPLLMAFKKELLRSYQKNQSLPTRITEYLVGKFDFYKMIGEDNIRRTLVQTYNLHGTLNKQGKVRKTTIKVPVPKMPTRIISLDFKPNSKTTLELYMDEGWQFSFRIHNASSVVETSLKFDIQLVGVPVTILSYECHWLS